MKHAAARMAMPTAACGKSPTASIPVSGSAMAAMRTLSTSRASATQWLRGAPRKTVP